MKALLTCLVLLLSCGTALAAESAESAEKILDCMRANVPSSLRAQDVEFSTTYHNGTTSTLKGRLYVNSEEAASGKRHVRAALYLTSPSNLAGAAYLVREKDGDTRDGMYVYLPSVKRVRRVTGSIADGGLMGTSFSYADFKQMQNTFGEVKVTLEGTAEIEKRAMHVLAFRPVDNKDGGYDLVRAWVDYKSCVPLKAEFYRGSTVRKRLTTPAKALQQSDQRWYGTVLEMHDSEEDTRTVLRVTGVSMDKELPGVLFDPNTFYKR